MLLIGMKLNFQVKNGVLNNNNHIVLPDINISQVIYWFKTQYTTVVREQQQMIFGTLVQGADPIREYFRKIERYAKLGRVGDHQKRLQFMRGLSPENKLELKRIGINKPLNTELIDTLEQIEIEKIDMLLDTSGKPPANQGITSADIERIVNSRSEEHTSELQS